MNPQVPEELISAYFDGEVTPEERAAVERLLADNEDAQRELNETARLSALLHSFPRESAPLELVDNVLRQTSQMPLPSQPAQVPARPAKRTIWRDLGVAAISVISTAAIFLVVFSSMSASQQHGIAANNPQQFSPGPDRVFEPRAAERALSDRSPTEPMDVAAAPQVATRESSEFPAAPMAMTKSAAVKSEALPEASKDGSNSLAARDGVEKKAADKVTESIANVADEMPAEVEYANTVNPQSNESFLRGLSNNRFYNFYPAVADPENDVPVVEIPVIDLDLGIPQFEKILVKRLELRESTENKSDPDRRKRTQNSTVLILAEGPGERFVAALNDVNLHPDLYAGWSTQLPLSLGNVANSSNAPEPNSDPVQPARPVARRSEPEANPTPDIKEVAEALVSRSNVSNTLQMNGPGGQQVLNNMSRSGQYGFQQGRGRNLDSKAQSAGLGAGAKAKSGAPGNESGAYQILDLPNKDLPAPQFAQSITPNLNRVQANNSNGLESLSPPPPAPAPANARATSAAEKQQLNQQQQLRGDANTAGRALRMLFVLHPQAEPAQTAPAAATKPQ